MANAHSHDHDSHDASHGSVKSYAIGFILSVILTQRDNVIAFVFAGLVILLLVGLSIWIMFSIHTFMMAK